MREVGLFGRTGVKKPLISKKNKKVRLESAKKHHSWTLEEWKKVESISRLESYRTHMARVKTKNRN